MAKVKPQRKNRVAAAVYEETISNENIIQRKIIEAQETITLVDIKDIVELTCEDGTIMYNRITYPSHKLKELSDDIKDLNEKKTGILETGILNPVMLRNNNGKLERIHGSNRIQAAQMAGLTQVPAVILDNVSEISFLLTKKSKAFVSPLITASTLKHLSSSKSSSINFFEDSKSIGIIIDLPSSIVQV